MIVLNTVKVKLQSFPLQFTGLIRLKKNQTIPLQILYMGPFSQPERSDSSFPASCLCAVILLNLMNTNGEFTQGKTSV